MNIKNEVKTENKLTITETDIINGGEVIILTAYAVKDNDYVWQFPSPQIWNDEIYNKYKLKYDEQILAFRNDCENIENKGSIIASEIENLKTELTVTQEAINEILFMEV